eukprot:9030444-Pyramimonas_sp.AAC.1
MVGPDVFYEDQLPHVFGIHLSSYRCANTSPTVFTLSTSVIDNLIYQREQFDVDFYTRHILPHLSLLTPNHLFVPEPLHSEPEETSLELLARCHSLS